MRFSNVTVALLGLSLLAGCGQQAAENRRVEHDHAVTLGGFDFGFTDGSFVPPDDTETREPNYQGWSQVHLGPLGSYDIPISAGLGWVLVGALGWLAISLVIYKIVKRDRRQGHRQSPTHSPYSS